MKDPKVEGKRWLEQASEKNPAFHNLATAANQLDRFYIPTRYPNGLPGGIPAETYTEADAKQAIELAGEIMRLVKSLLN